MADPRLFFFAPDGTEDTQVSVQSVGQGSTRQVASFITPDDVPGVTVLPDGAFVGQAVFWDGSAWVPVPPDGSQIAIDGLKSIAPSATQLLLTETTAQLTADTAQLSDSTAATQVLASATAFQSTFSDGVNTTLALGDTSGFAVSASGFVNLTSHGVTQTMLDEWQVTLGEGADFVSLSLTLGFLVQVEPGLDITLTNGDGCQYSMQPEIHVFRTPDAVGTPVNNLQLSHDAADPTVGFCGHGPAKRQVIVGQEVHSQVDSLVDALVAFGLGTDSRTANNSKGLLGWNLSGVQVLTLLPAGHPPGLYSVSANLFIRTVATGGNLNAPFFSWSEPGGVAATLTFGAVNPTTLGLVFTVTRSLLSDGVNALTFTITPAAITGSPVANLSAGAILITGPVV